MAGDWIKMRVDLTDDPAVIGIAARLNLDEFSVVGRLQALWAWADSQSRDGHASGVTETWINRKLQCDGFAEAMVAVGWLIVDACGITFPNFDNHNGETAKTRAMGKKRKQKQRASEVCHDDVTQLKQEVSRNDRDKSVTREEKRREEKNNNNNTAVDDDDGTPKGEIIFGAVAVDDWIPDNKLFQDLSFMHGVPQWFIDQQVAEFKTYWRERGDFLSTWSAKFMQRCADQWARKCGVPLRSVS